MHIKALIKSVKMYKIYTDLWSCWKHVKAIVGTSIKGIGFIIDKIFWIVLHINKSPACWYYDTWCIIFSSYSLLTPECNYILHYNKNNNDQYNSIRIKLIWRREPYFSENQLLILIVPGFLRVEHYRWTCVIVIEHQTLQYFSNFS